jgi:hypothetical protein
LIPVVSAQRPLPSKQCQNESRIIMKSVFAAAVLLGFGLAIPGPLGSARANPATVIPPSEAVKQERVLASLQEVARRATPAGIAARQVIVVLNKYNAFQNETILPPLSLLPALATGKASPDMIWAISMSDRLRDERPYVQGLHRDIVATILDLRAAAIAEHDSATTALTEDLAAADLAQVEVTEPTAEMVGELVRNKLPPT